MSEHVPRPRLVMTLLVRNEADIIAHNLDYHLARGVDHVIATDNASDDGTTEILEAYARQGVLTLQHEPSDAYEQDVWITRMAHQARETCHADWILNNDADEFWEPFAGDLKQALVGIETPMLSCPRRNMITAFEWLGRSAWYENLVYAADPQLPMPKLDDLLKDPLGAPYFYFRLPPKVLVCAHGLERIPRGGHSAVFKDRSAKSQRGAIQIHHFPIRNRDAFARTVKRIGEAVNRKPDLPTTVSWKYRRWLAMTERHGTIDAALQEALPDAERLQADLEAGRLVESHDMMRQLSALPASRNAAARSGRAQSG